jgi:preprotein translocase subunit SecG
MSKYFYAAGSFNRFVAVLVLLFVVVFLRLSYIVDDLQ